MKNIREIKGIPTKEKKLKHTKEFIDKLIAKSV